MAQSNAGLGRVSLTVKGTDDNGTAVGTSSTFHLQFAQRQHPGCALLLDHQRVDGDRAVGFAGATQKATPYLTPTNTDGKTCVGCHALSPNGDKLVASAGGQNDGRVLLGTS